MTLKDFGILLMSKSTQRKSIAIDDVYIEKVYSAIKRVAKDTVPLTLLVNSPIGQRVMRKIDDNAYIRYPKKAINETDIVDVDEALLDAVALYVMAGLETQRAKIYMGLYYTEIENNDAVQIEASINTDSANPPNRNPDKVFL